MGAVSRRGTKLLNSVVDYLYDRAQKCRTIDEADPLKLALAICGAVRKGSSQPFTDASYQVFGRPLAAYRLHRMKEQFQQASDLRRCINECPDVVTPIQVGTETQRSGALHQMQPASLPKKDAVQDTSRPAKTTKQATTG
jgi:hypothetical protein